MMSWRRVALLLALSLALCGSVPMGRVKDAAADPKEVVPPPAPDSPAAEPPKEPAAAEAPKEPAAAEPPKEPAAAEAPKEPAAAEPPKEPAAAEPPKEPAVPKETAAPDAPEPPKEPAAPKAPVNVAAPAGAKDGVGADAAAPAAVAAAAAAAAAEDSAKVVPAAAAAKKEQPAHPGHPGQPPPGGAPKHPEAPDDRDAVAYGGADGYEDDDERLYADQEEDFDAYNDDDDGGGAPEAGKTAHPKKKEAMKKDMDKEYMRYLEEMRRDLESDPTKRDEMIEELETLREKVGEGSMPDEERELLVMARKLREKEQVRTRLEEQERITIEHQRRQAQREQLHKAGLDPRAGEAELGDPDLKIFMDEKVDHMKLLSIAKKRVEQMGNLDRDRRRAFMQHEMRRLIDFKKLVEAEADPAKKATMIQEHDKQTQELDKRRGHAPGHKAQLQDVWEKEDGLDRGSFNPKTFFRLHDVTGDGVLDAKELEAMFYREAKRMHVEALKSGKKTSRDKFIVAEEVARMREFMMKSTDKNNDGMISEDEFMSSSKDKSFGEDKGWKPINPEREVTDKQLESFKRLQDKLQKTKHNEVDPKLLRAAKKMNADLQQRARRENEQLEKAKKPIRFPNLGKLNPLRKLNKEDLGAKIAAAKAALAAAAQAEAKEPAGAPAEEEQVVVA